MQAVRTSPPPSPPRPEPRWDVPDVEPAQLAPEPGCIYAPSHSAPRPVELIFSAMPAFITLDCPLARPVVVSLEEEVDGRARRSTCSPPFPIQLKLGDAGVMLAQQPDRPFLSRRILRGGEATFSDLVIPSRLDHLPGERCLIASYPGRQMSRQGPGAAPANPSLLARSPPFRLLPSPRAPEALPPHQRHLASLSSPEQWSRWLN